MKILNFGSCNLDNVYSVPHVVQPGETLAASTFAQFVGGKGLNQSVALANAGAQVFHAGLIGEDGAVLRTFLEQAGVDTRYLQTVSEKTGQAIIQVDEHGENCIVLYAGANHAFTKAYIDTVLADFGEGDFLVLQNEINLLAYIVDAAAARGMKIFLNPAPFGDALQEIDLDKVYCILPNEIEAAAICKGGSFADFIREQHPALCAVVTQGKRGATFMDAAQTVFQPAFVTKAVDTTAAGDTFVGFFVATLARGGSVQQALETAAAASSITVSRKGAAPSIPLLCEVEALLKNIT